MLVSSAGGAWCLVMVVVVVVVVVVVGAVVVRADHSVWACDFRNNTEWWFTVSYHEYYALTYHSIRSLFHASSSTAVLSPLWHCHA